MNTKINLPEIQELLQEYNRSSKITRARKEEIEKIITQWINTNSNPNPYEYEYSWVAEISNKFQEIQQKKYNPVTINTVLYNLLGMKTGTEEHLELLNYCMEHRDKNTKINWLYESRYQDYQLELKEKKLVSSEVRFWLFNKNYLQTIKIAKYMKEHQVSIYEIWTPKEEKRSPKNSTTSSNRTNYPKQTMRSKIILKKQSQYKSKISSQMKLKPLNPFEKLAVG